MKKNLKKIIALAIGINILGISVPTINSNVIITKAYADEITNLTIKDSNDDNMYIYDNSTCNDKDRVDSDEIKSGRTYYTRQTSADDIDIKIEGIDSDYVRVFNRSDSKEGQSIDSSINLVKGSNNIVIRTYDSPVDSSVDYSTSYKNQYTIRVKYSGDSEDDEDSGNVYLRSITLEGANINFSKKVYEYNIQVSEDVSKISVKARPSADKDDYDDYKVKINGIKVTSDDKFKDDVSLKKGKNVIEVKVEHDDAERTYTLNITRGKDNNSTTTNTQNNNTNQNNQSNNTTLGDDEDKVVNQWVIINGGWKYKDAAGNTAKNTWIGNYYVKEDGSLATGWLNNQGSWYYLGEDGAKKTGWQAVNGKWYYLNNQGTMQIGWLQDPNSGKYYYLNLDGSMAYDTKIGGYTLGLDGSWNGR